MRLDSVTAEIRPRSDWEAADLGLAMARRDFWRCFAVWWLGMLPVLAAGFLLWDQPLWWLLLFWWCKPLGGRMVLFEISRRLFGERPPWRASLRELPRAWTRRIWFRLGWARFSPWLPVTMAVEDLEGLRGKDYKRRCAQVTRRGEGVMLWIYFIADLAACWFGLAILLVAGMFIPEGQEGGWRLALEMWNPEMPFDIPVEILRTATLCLMLAMALVDLFVTGCGFGIYLNNRTWIEGWDVELGLKRLARRLGGAAALLVALAMLAGILPGHADEPEPSAASERMTDVMAHPDFKVHTVEDRVPKPKGNWDWLKWLNRSGGDIGWLGKVFGVSLLVLALAFLAWLVWINRHRLQRLATAETAARPAPRARVVMGMEVSPESLPADIPASALELWHRGQRQEALGLLYRGAISRIIEAGTVEIHESDTEGECLRRVDAAGTLAQPGYFRGLTRAWMGLAYGGRLPADSEIESLCGTWPYLERGPR